MGSPPETCSLDLLLKEERALVSAVKTEDNRDGRALRVRLNALGINLGKEVSIIRRAWLGGQSCCALIRQRRLQFAVQKHAVLSLQR